MKQENAAFDQVLKAAPEEFLKSWLEEATGNGGAGSSTSQHDARELLGALQDAIGADADMNRFDDAGWARVRSVLALKKPLFAGLQKRLASDPKAAFDAAWMASRLSDKLAQFTVTTYQRSREEVIQRQQQELLELSTPVVKLWEGVLAVPMIGTLDSSRTQLVMESLLTRIVETGSELAIIDITGVPTVDTLVAQHLIKTVAAARLMGADCIVSGIRPQIAQTIVHLGVDLSNIITKATLADAFAIALRRVGLQVTTKSA
jgi:rsbT co-antagonist protein RsbR